MRFGAECAEVGFPADKLGCVGVVFKVRKLTCLGCRGAEI